MLIDLHTHTLLSDGSLIVAEQLRRAEIQGYDYIGITDHCDFSNIEQIVSQTIKGCQAFNDNSNNLKALPGVEITHVHPKDIPVLTKKARALGAILVGVHGETIVEPVYPGTNRAAIEAQVDFLAHPGIISEDDVKRAAGNGVFLEITSRKGHCLGNGRLVALARKYRAQLIINSDTHAPSDLYSPERYRKTAFGAGLSPGEFNSLLDEVERFAKNLLGL